MDLWICYWADTLKVRTYVRSTTTAAALKLSVEQYVDYQDTTVDMGMWLLKLFSEAPTDIHDRSLLWKCYGAVSPWSLRARRISRRWWLFASSWVSLLTSIQRIQSID